MAFNLTEKPTWDTDNDCDMQGDNQGGDTSYVDGLFKQNEVLYGILETPEVTNNHGRYKKTVQKIGHILKLNARTVKTATIREN